MTESKNSYLPLLDRRDFLRVSGTMAAAGAITAAGCKPPPETSLPFNQRPEGLRTPGKAKAYATVIDDAAVLARVREGRPILIAPNPKDPSGRGLTLRSHAALLDLYDPDRAGGPLSVRRGQGALVDSDWEIVGSEVIARLRAKQGDVALLTGAVSGVATRALLDELSSSLGLRHVSYTPLDSDVAGQAWRAAFGDAARPRPRLDRAALVVGFGAEFIDQPADGLERDFAARRDPDVEGGMSRFVQLEGRLSLTGANADQRLRVRDSQLGNVAAAVAHTLIVKQKLGPLAADAAVQSALASFAPEKVGALAGVEPATIMALARELVAAQGRAVVLAGGSASEGAAGLALETAVLLINHSLGNYDGVAFERSEAAAPGAESVAALEALVADIKAKKISTLLIAGPNPVYDAPAALDFAGALASLELVVSLNDRVDETSAMADFLAPASHALESWGDAALGAGVLALQQPVIRPLYDTHGLLDVLVAWGAAAGAGGKIAVAAASTTPQKKGEAPPAQQSGAYHYIRAHWLTEVLPRAAAWEETLRAGWFVADRRQAPASAPATAPAAAPAFSAASVALLGAPAALPGELELQLYPHFALHDGRCANNGWLLEFPDPITRLTWGGAASIAPRRFDAMGLENGDLVELSLDSGKLQLPAYRHAGMHQDQIAVPLGLGRTRCGEIGAGVGVNAFGLRQLKEGRALRAGLVVSLSRARGHESLAGGQGADVIDRESRQLVPTATLAEYKKDPHAGTEQVHGGPSAWPDHPYEGQRWAMAIDLSRCNGCGKCTISCQAENNIPVVGKKAIIDGREMAWIRIDRYYDAPKREGGWDDKVWDGPLEVVEEPVTLFEPMLCQHCENAPCETVCPFNATMHSADGLNQQAYNRCVGTRYCANNCPFKVRRYNWFEYSAERQSLFYRTILPEMERHAALNVRGRMQMKNNPEVTVRSRGVMEKCSFCVQRIREARAEAMREGRKDLLPDGAVVPACMEACPTGAIVFGDVNDASSRVAKAVRDPRAMRLLELTGVKPSVYYLTRVRNDNV